jgi:hypothetical protein
VGGLSHIDSSFEGFALGVDPIFYDGALDVGQGSEDTIEQYAYSFIIVVQHFIMAEFI